MPRRRHLEVGQIWRPHEGADRRIVAIFGVRRVSEPVPQTILTPHEGAAEVKPAPTDSVHYSTGSRTKSCNRTTFNRWVAAKGATRTGNRRPEIMKGKP
jgi:hypothetical protein